jgi:CheY-like chemotaxis protein
MKTILVVEDNAALRENTAELLEVAGYEVVQAINGKDAYKQVLKFQPDVIACDIIMPELDGIGFLKKLRKKSSTRDIPFVFFSIDYAPFSLQEGIEKKNIIYLLKPFTNEELLDAVKQCLDYQAT